MAYIYNIGVVLFIVMSLCRALFKLDIRLDSFCNVCFSAENEPVVWVDIPVRGPSGSSISYHYQKDSERMELIVTSLEGVSKEFYLSHAVMLTNDFEFVEIDPVHKKDFCYAGDVSSADIIKHFHNDFKILVISHNDRLKDKVVNKIVVSQDANMVSKARVIN